MLDFLRHIAPALITVIGGGLVLNWFFVGRANLAALVERTCDILSSLQQDCASYWSCDYRTDQEERQLEAKVKAGLVQLSALIGLACDKRPECAMKLEAMVPHLNDLCTGGDFETVSRKSDPPRLMRIASTISKISIELQKLKIWSPLDLLRDPPDMCSRDRNSHRPVI